MVVHLQTTQHKPKNSCKPDNFRQILQFVCGVIIKRRMQYAVKCHSGRPIAPKVCISRFLNMLNPNLLSDHSRHTNRKFVMDGIEEVHRWHTLVFMEKWTDCEKWAVLRNGHIVRHLNEWWKFSHTAKFKRSQFSSCRLFLRIFNSPGMLFIHKSCKFGHWTSEMIIPWNNELKTSYSIFISL